MKKLFLLIVSAILFLPFTTLADTYYIENGTIQITEEDYNNLRNLAFEPNEIYTMGLEEFNANKDLEGRIVSEATLDLSEFPELGLNPDVTCGCENGNARASGYCQTAYKKMTSYIIEYSGYYRFKVTLEWLQMPAKRSWDIIALGYDPDVAEVAISPTFHQSWCYSSGTCNGSYQGYYYSYDDAEMVVFDLPNGTNVTSMNSYMYYDVVEASSTADTSVIETYADYAHATTTLSSAPSSSELTFLEEIWFTGSYDSYYDDISTVHLYQNANW